MPTIFHIFANAALGKGLSGSDRIFIELSRRLSKKYPVTIHVWKEGYEICLSQNLKSDKNLKYEILKVGFWCDLGFVICYFARIIQAIKEAIFLEIPNDKSSICYSASEFWMDSLPALILKLRFPRIKWVAAWFQTAPNPLIGFTRGKRQSTYKLTAFYYWLMQLPIKPFIKKFADFVLVNNENEKKQFQELDRQGKVIMMLGAVNFKEIENWIHRHGLAETKTYDAVFQGRFHPQKGVVELIEIWKRVTDKLPQAKLALIGDGPLREDVEAKIKKLGLSRNIKLFGYVFDGSKKYNIFADSKIVVHPSFYDSGGMAAAEAMAFGLPAVGFNLDSYKSYYPFGMIKVQIGNIEVFANSIVKLIKDEREREKIGNEAQEMIRKNWSWDKRANFLIKSIENSITSK